MKDFVEKGLNFSRKSALLGAGSFGVGEILTVPILPTLGLGMLVFSGISYLGLNFLRSRDRRL